jgi:predicted anti-sigma-YlaC factor YlaD
MNVCRKMTELISQRLDRRLSVTERFSLRFHLMMCKGCRNFSRNMASLREVFSFARRTAKGDASSSETS